MIKDFDLFCTDNGINEKLKVYINSIRAAKPSREFKIGETKNKVIGFYSSDKMELNIQYKKTQPHIAAFFIMEFDNDVYEYYYEPPSFNLDATDNVEGYKFTADFFVISKEFIGWEVWETDEDLFKMSILFPDLYVSSKKGSYSCPPVEKFARMQGLSFRIRSSKENKTLLEKVKNSLFEDSY